MEERAAKQMEKAKKLKREAKARKKKYFQLKKKSTAPPQGTSIVAYSEAKKMTLQEMMAGNMVGLLCGWYYFHSRGSCGDCPGCS